MASDEEKLIPAGMRDERALAFAAVLARLGELDLSPLLVYLVDQAPETVLPHLAEQFSVLGYDGWLMTTTDDERRALIKKSVELHRYKGTPWAIKEVIKAVGFPDVEIFERPPKRYHDGTITRDRSDYYGIPGAQWALFRVLVDLADETGIGAPAAGLVRGGINAYKNRRSWLQHLGFRTRISDQVDVTEELAIKVKPRMAEVLLEPFRRDGRHRHNGTARRDARAELVNVTIRYRTLHNGLRRHNGTTFRGATFVEAL